MIVDAVPARVVGRSVENDMFIQLTEIHSYMYRSHCLNFTLINASQLTTDFLAILSTIEAFHIIVHCLTHNITIEAIRIRVETLPGKVC
jgi:hypothetical protein